MCSGVVTRGSTSMRDLGRRVDVEVARNLAVQLPHLDRRQVGRRAAAPVVLHDVGAAGRARRRAWRSRGAGSRGSAPATSRFFVMITDAAAEGAPSLAERQVHVERERLVRRRGERRGAACRPGRRSCRGTRRRSDTRCSAARAGRTSRSSSRVSARSSAPDAGEVPGMCPLMTRPAPPSTRARRPRAPGRARAASPAGCRARG